MNIGCCFKCCHQIPPIAKNIACPSLLVKIFQR
nr:MAG TPA: hypothetical protein [Caudoviricetes sp.]